MPDYTPFYQARSLVQQSPGGQQVYQSLLAQLNRQFGLRQRRQQMLGEQVNLQPTQRFALAQQQYPELYGAYAGGATQAAAQAPGIDIQKAQALGNIQSQVEQLQLAWEQLEEQKRARRQSEKTNFWDVLGMVGGMGLGAAGLIFNPLRGLTSQAGQMGSAVSQGWNAGGYAQPSWNPYNYQDLLRP